ncbi:MAG: Clp protease N-terminal domain-containing protein, partial [Paracoccaceae bacterium]|nr:Clp protease N-terminal domain-containing protein [Paracoccaceae bacterium]
MNLEKFTERSREFIQSAQSDALASEHQRILPQHLLKVVLDDEQEFARNLLKKVSV